MGTIQLGALPGTSGTFVEIVEPAPGALRTPFGSTLMVGGFQWGPVDLVETHTGQQNYKALRGSAMREDYTPRNCEDFYKLARGSGRLMTLRVTDGTEVTAHTDIYARDLVAGRLLMTPYALPTRAMRVSGLYPGRRGGVKNLKVGYLANLATGFSATAGTFTTSTTMVKDAFKYAILTIQGVARSYKVTSNTAAGVLSIEVPSGDPGPTGAGVWTVLLSTPDSDGVRDGAGVQISGSLAQPASEFGLTMHDLRAPGPVSPSYPSLSLDSTLDAFVESKVNVDGTERRQHLLTIDADPDVAIGDTSQDEMRPANWVGRIRRTEGTRAEGTIQCVAVASLVDGETLVIGDGRRTVTFEFDVAGDGVTSGNTAVDVSADVTPDDVSVTLRAAINASALVMQATPDAGVNGLIMLTGEAMDAANVTITETVANAGFLVTGMASGSAPSNAMYVETTHWARVDTTGGGGTAYLNHDSPAYGASAWTRCVAVCTFTAPTAFTVEYKDWEEETTYATGFAAGATGTLFNPQSVALPSFTIEAGSVAMAATDIVKVYFHPLPENMKDRGGILYAHAHDQGDATNNIRTSFRVKSNTQNYVTLPTATDLGADHLVAAPGRPRMRSPLAGPYNLAGAETFIYTLDGASAVTLTNTLVGAATSASALAIELNALEAVAHPDLAWVVFSADTSGRLVCRATNSDGSSSALVPTTGTLNAILGLTNSTTYNGSDGSLVAFSYAQELMGGTDGVAALGEGTEYTDAFDIGTSPINDILTSNYGVVKVAMPGVSAATETDQNAAIAYCDEVGYEFTAEIDPSIGTTETTAAAHTKDNLTGSRNRRLAWNSYGYPRSKSHTGVEVAIPMSGALLGMEANLAARRGGYHIAAAGTKASIGEVFGSLASVTFGQDAPRFDEALLNPVGISTIQQEGALMYPNGGRSSDDDYVGTIWRHKQLCILHIMHQLRVAGAPFVWEDLSPETRNRLVSTLIPVFREMFDAGWFIRGEDQSFFDVVQIQAGDEENPPAVQVLGELRAVIQISGIVGAAERVVFTLGTGGVTAT